MKLDLIGEGACVAVGIPCRVCVLRHVLILYYSFVNLIVALGDIVEHKRMHKKPWRNSTISLECLSRMNVSFVSTLLKDHFMTFWQSAMWMHL